MTTDPGAVVDRAWRLLAFSFVGVAAVVVNLDPVIDSLPNIPQGAGLPVSETAKQSLALAIILLVVAAVGAAIVIRRPASSGAVGLAAVVGAGAVAAVIVFLLVLAFAGDDRRGFVVGTLVVVTIAAVAGLLRAPTITYANVSAKPFVAVVGGVVLVAGYAFALNYMFSRAATDNSVEWERLIALFAGVEAIGFAAVGAVLGSEVQKTQTVTEAARADQNAAGLAEAKRIGEELGETAEGTIPTPEDDTGGGNPAQLGVARERVANLRGKLASIPNPR